MSPTLEESKSILETKKEKTTLAQKVAKIKSEIGVMSKDKSNPFYKSSYFDINQLIQVIRPLEEKYNISITQPLTRSESYFMGGMSAKPSTLIRLRIVDLDTGEEEAYETPIPENPDPQKMGSAITYYRRYTLVSYLGIEAEDDDGNSSYDRNVSSAPKVASKGKNLPSGGALGDKSKTISVFESTKNYIARTPKDKLSAVHSKILADTENKQFNKVEKEILLKLITDKVNS